MISGWWQIWDVVSKPPCTTFKTPFGKLIYLSNLHICYIAPGTLSDGLSTKVFPQVMASGNIHNGIIAGKLNGATPAQTPNGVLNE